MKSSSLKQSPPPIRYFIASGLFLSHLMKSPQYFVKLSATTSGTENTFLSPSALITIFFISPISPFNIVVVYSVCLSPVSPLYHKGFGQSPYPYGCTHPKAPSGRELPTESGEGECVTIKHIKTSKLRGLLPSRFACHLPPGGRLFC